LKTFPVSSNSDGTRFRRRYLIKTLSGAGGAYRATWRRDIGTKLPGALHEWPGTSEVAGYVTKTIPPYTRFCRVNGRRVGKPFENLYGLLFIRRELWLIRYLVTSVVLLRCQRSTASKLRRRSVRRNAFAYFVNWAKKISKIHQPRLLPYCDRNVATTDDD